MKKIGILGGMSYESTLHYYEGINKKVNEIEGGLVTPELLIDSVNFNEFRKYMLNNDWLQIKIELLKRALFLQNIGADYIVIATNTMHKVAPFIEENINVPLIHIGDSVSNKNISQGINNVGLIGTKYTMQEEFMRKRLINNGLIINVPNYGNDINEIDRVIFNELCKGIVLDSSREKYIEIINKMIRLYGIEGIILGCTEICMLITKNDTCIPIYDTTECHINDIADYALERKLKCNRDIK